MKLIDETANQTAEKWILRKACGDLLPSDLIWRKKAQFDEGTGTIDVLNQAISQITGINPPVDRKNEGELYERLLCEQFKDPNLILTNAGMWTADRIEVNASDSF